MTDTRPSAEARGYGLAWRRYRESYLRDHRLCVPCKRAGLSVRATTIDHIQPHRGDKALFWNPTNHMATCTHCHNSDKQRQEKSGVTQYRGCDVDGTPLDPEHPWQKRGNVLGGGIIK